MYYSYMDSPVGRLLLAGNESSLGWVFFEKESRPVSPRPEWQERPRPFRDVIKQLDAYFEGKRRDFDLELAPEGTPFQQRVWRELRAIPYGETISYGELARRIGRPNAFRAVGAANGRNPISIIVPCHRVIGSNGSLTGFGGGLDTKRALLEHEQGNQQALLPLSG